MLIDGNVCDREKPLGANEGGSVCVCVAVCRRNKA